MTTLNDMLLAVSRFSLVMHSGAATGGGTTTLVDNLRKQISDQFNAGIIFFLTGTNAGKYTMVADYDGATGTFTFSTTGLVVSGVLYEACALSSGANMYDIVRAINQALFELGDIPTIIDYVDDATLISATDTEEYALPTGVRNVRQMWVAGATSAPYKWRKFTHFTENNGYLYIPYQYTGYLGDGYPLRLKYYAPHSVLDTYEDVVNPNVNKQWLTYAASVNLLRSLGTRIKSWGEVKVPFEEAQQKVISVRPLVGDHNIMVRVA